MESECWERENGMKLKEVSVSEITALSISKPVHTYVIYKEKINDILTDFMQRGTFVMEVDLCGAENMNTTRLAQAFKECIHTNGVHAGVHERHGRLFLRNDDVPLCMMVSYPRNIVNASRRNRFNFE